MSPELIQALVMASAAYREMSQGNQTIGGFCLAMANRLDYIVLRAVTPPTMAVAVSGTSDAISAEVR